MNVVPLILKLDITGSPTSWIDYIEAIRLYTTDHVVADLGTQSFLFRGGINAITRRQSSIQVASIILTRGKAKRHYREDTYVPHLTNKSLFRRDGHICLYCGDQFRRSQLTRDHVLPLSRGGGDSWENVVTACFICNNRKGNRTPEEWGKYNLIAVPYVPNKAEYLFLENRKIIADQQAFLLARFRKNSVIADRYDKII
ncbi:MAG: HNH endonuclease [Thiohalomonadales bacterium]